MRLWIFALLALASGCRFGNFQDKAKGVEWDGMTGFYRTAPQSLTFCSVISDNEVCRSAQPATQTPEFFAGRMTSLVLFQPAAPEQRIAYLANSSLNQWFTVVYGEDNRTLTRDYSQEGPAWDDAACTHREAYLGRGRLAPEAALTLEGDKPIAGRLSMNWAFYNFFRGDCAGSLSRMAGCYQDTTQCPGSNADIRRQYQELARQIFDPYIDAGVLTLSEIPDLSAIAYEVSYE